MVVKATYLWMQNDSGLKKSANENIQNSAFYLL